MNYPVYYGARYYHPSLGRWLSREPMGEAESKNLYAMAGNDPVDGFEARLKGSKAKGVRLFTKTNGNYALNLETNK